MRSKTRIAIAALVLGLGAFGCELALDFDRTKIAGGIDASFSDAPPGDTFVPPGDAADVETDTTPEDAQGDTAAPGDASEAGEDAADAAEAGDAAEGGATDANDGGVDAEDAADADGATADADGGAADADGASDDGAADADDSG